MVGNRLRLELFGGPRVVGPEGALRLSPFRLALLTIVSAHGPSGVSRPQVARLLWPRDGDESRVRHRIREHLAKLRLKVAPDVVLSDADRLFLNPLRIDCDTDLLERMIRDRALIRAASLVAEGFASRYLSAPTDTFDDWRLAQGIRFTQSVWRAAASAWDEAFMAGRWEPAREAAEALYLLQPNDPSVVARVVESRARVGRVGSAEAAYAAYLGALDADEQPSPELDELIRRVRDLGPTGMPLPQDVLPEAPFIGRVSVLDQARRLLASVKNGAFEVLVISGESGIGKTRVLEEVRREALLSGFRCLRAQPVEVERRIPLNPLVDALSEVDLDAHLRELGPPWNAVIGSLLPPGAISQPAGVPPHIQESHLSRRLLDALSLLMRRLVEQEPTILLLDDLHWVDATTVTALQFMQRRWESGPFGIVTAVRPDALSKSDPAWKYLEPTDGISLQNVHLAELTQEEARELVHRLTDGRVSSDIEQRICALAGDHPLYLTEIAKDFVSGRMKLPELPADEVTIPISLKQILSSRLENLSPAALRVAGLLAVRARTMRLADLSSLAAMSLDACAECAEELHRHRLVQVERDTVRIVHDLFRSALYRHMSEPRRALFHRIIAEHLAANDPEVPTGELAIHYARAGEPAAAAAFGWVAATRALENGAVAEAAHFFDLVTNNEPDRARRAEATAELARALHLNRDIRRANPLLELAATRLREVGNGHQALRIEIRSVEGLAEEGATSIRDLLDRLGSIKHEARAIEDWEAVALALDAELHLLHHDGNVEGVRGLTTELREIAAGQCGAAQALSLAGLAVANTLFEDAAEALELAEAAERISGEEPQNEYRLRILNRLIVVLYHGGLLDDSGRVSILEEARNVASSSGDLLERFAFEANLAAYALDVGDLDRAEVLLEKAEKLLGSADMTLSRINQACNHGELALARGDYARARQAFTLTSSFLGMAIPRFTADFVNAGLGLCAFETGDLSEARRREGELGELPATWYFDPTTILAFRTRILERRGRRDDAIRLLEEASQGLQGRLILAGLKIDGLLADLLSRGNRDEARRVSLRASGVAAHLGLNHRAQQFARRLEKCA